MTEYQLPEPDSYYEGSLGQSEPAFSEEQMQAAYAAGREAMRQECADFIFNMAQWDENNEQWVVLHRAATAIRNLK